MTDIEQTEDKVINKPQNAKSKPVTKKVSERTIYSFKEREQMKESEHKRFMERGKISAASIVIVLCILVMSVIYISEPPNLQEKHGDAFFEILKYIVLTCTGYLLGKTDR